MTGATNMDIVTYDRMLLGAHIADVASDVALAAADTKKPHTFTFNGVVVEVTPGDTAAAIVKRYEAGFEARRVAWEASPEGQRRRREMADRVAAAQAEIDAAYVDLASLDLEDRAAVIAWLERIAEHTDMIGVNVPTDKILSLFVAYGYRPNMNCGIDFDGEDRDNFAGYIIGQALDGLESIGAIHPIVSRFAAEWRAKFGVTTP